MSVLVWNQSQTRAEVRVLSCITNHSVTYAARTKGKKKVVDFFYLYKFSSFFPQTGHTDVVGRAVSVALFSVLNISVAGTSEPSGVRYKKNPKTLTQRLIFK